MAFHRIAPKIADTTPRTIVTRMFMSWCPGMKRRANTPITSPAKAYHMKVQNEMSAAIMASPFLRCTRSDRADLGTTLCHDAVNLPAIRDALELMLAR